MSDPADFASAPEPGATDAKCLAGPGWDDVPVRERERERELCHNGHACSPKERLKDSINSSKEWPMGLGSWRNAIL